MMFDYFGWADAAKKIENAVRAALRQNKTPADLGGSLGTQAIGDFVANHIAGM